MLGDVTRRPQTGQPPGVQSDGSAQPRQIPAGSSPGSGTGATDEGGSISAVAAPRADLRTAPVARTVSPTAPGEWSAVPLAGDLPTERHRLPARVTRYWRWRAFCSSRAALGPAGQRWRSCLPWGPWWVRWGVVGVCHCGDRCRHDHLATDPIPCLLVRDLADGDRHPAAGSSSPRAASCRCIACRTLRSERGPIADHYRMTTLKIRTAAGSVSLSGLDRGRG